MSNSSVVDWDSLSAKTLNTILRSMVGNDGIDIDHWQYEPLTRGSTGGGSVYRVTGTANSRAELVTWSLIAKVLSSPSVTTSDTNSRQDPTHIDYWKREMLVYQSALFQELPTGLAVPQCYHIEEWPMAYRLWQEDITTVTDVTWPLERFGLAARHLGRFAGNYLVDKTLPDWPWLTNNVLRQREERAASQGVWEKFPALWAQYDLLRSGWPKDVADEIRRTWDDRALFFRMLEGVPQTVQHGDAGRKNMFSRSQGSGLEETVVIDWGMVGIGAIGEEIAPLVCSTVLWFNDISAEQIVDLEEAVLAGYLQGLLDVGWHGDPALVRLGYKAAVALRFGPFTHVIETIALDPNKQTYLEDLFHHTLDEIIANYRTIRQYVAACAIEARVLTIQNEK